MTGDTAPLKLCLFGSAHLEIDGAALTVPLAKKEFWLLALLALQQGKALGRDYLAGLLWPDCIEEQALYNLRRCLNRLRDALGAHANCVQPVKPRSLCFQTDGAFVDVLEFDRSAAENNPERLLEALSLYCGPLLQDCFEEWVLPERLPREFAYQRVLETLATHSAANQDWLETERYARLWIAADPLQEQAHRVLMEALARSGNHAKAATAYRDLRLRLREEINADPDPETRALYETIRQEARQAPTERPKPNVDVRPPASPPTPHSSLPQPLTRLIGRELERDAVLAALNSSRLVTLAAAGGIGKTRLAIEAAQRSEEQYADGATFLEFAAISDPLFLTREVAQAVGVAEEPNVALLDALINALKNQERLLVLDNCEHLLDACARLADALLRACPKLRILATSRQPLGLSGETVQRLLPLPTPPEPSETGASVQEKLDQSALLDYPAVQLFLDRVHQACPEFHLSPADLPPLARICRRLDGIPLALELAAHRVRSLSLEKIAARLENRFQLLTGGDRTALPRQKTLRALIDWSYQLLDPAERDLFARLSVFAGGWTLEMAEQVCTSEGIEAWELLDLTASLTDRSLILYDGGQGRYRFLETIHEYARERMQEMGEAQTLIRRHAEVVLRLAEEAEPQLMGPKQAVWTERLEQERQNLRAVLANSLKNRETASIGLKLVGLVWRFWLISGTWREGVAYLTDSLAAAGSDADARDRAAALNAIGVIAFRMGDFKQARTALEECIPLRQALGDREGMGGAYHNLATLLMSEGDPVEARRIFEQSLEIHREFNRPTKLAQNHIGLGNAAIMLGDFPSARLAYEEALALSLQAGDPHGELLALGNLGYMALLDKDAAASESYGRRTLELCRALGNREGEACYLPILAQTALMKGDFAGAREYYLQTLEAAQRLGDKRILAATVDAMGSLRMEEKEFRDAVRFYACATNHYQIIGMARPPYEQEEKQKALKIAKEAIGSPEFDKAWQEGARLSLEEAVLLVQS